MAVGIEVNVHLSVFPKQIQFFDSLISMLNISLNYLLIVKLPLGTHSQTEPIPARLTSSWLTSSFLSDELPAEKLYFVDNSILSIVLTFRP
jgi:hypothetical protein